MTIERDDSPPRLMSVGIDIGKDVFHVVGFDHEGRIALRRKIKRMALSREFEKLPPCLVGMEACLSAHFVSRTLRALGHSPRIIPAKYTKPFNKGQKNDYNDAEAIAEAALRPNLRIESVGPSMLTGGSVALTRLPSGRRRSTMGEAWSIRRPTFMASRSMSRRR